MSLAQILSESKPKRKGLPGSRKVLWECGLLKLRTKLKLTLREVAKAVDMVPSALSAVERGADLKLSNAMALAQFYDVSVESLWELK